MSVSDNIDYIQNGENIDEVVLNRPSKQLANEFDRLSLVDAIKKESTLMLDFANNEYRLYEGDDGQTWLPFEEVVDITRASEATYVDATGTVRTVGIDEKRLTYKNGKPDGLLIEEQRTNLLLQSEDLSSSEWVGNAIDLTTDSETAPDGTLTADIIVPDGTGLYTGGISVTPDTEYTFSVWVKLLDADIHYFGAYDETNFAFIVNPNSYSSDAVKGEWTRVKVTFTTPSTCMSIRVYCCRGNSERKSQAIWGAQLEQGSTASSYIKTEGSQVTRLADQVIRTLGQEFNGINDDWTVFCEYRCDPILGINQRLISFNSAGNTTGEFFINGSGGGGNPAANFNAETFTSIGLDASQGVRVAVSKSQSEVIVTANGIHWGTDTTFSPPNVEVRDMLIGGPGGAFNSLGGEVKNIHYFPRALSEAELIALTTPEA